MMEVTTVINSNITIKSYPLPNQNKVVIVASGAGNHAVDATELLMAVHNAINIKEN